MTVTTAVGQEPVGSVVEFVTLMIQMIMDTWEAFTVDPMMVQRVVGSVLIVTAPEFQKPTL